MKKFTLLLALLISASVFAGEHRFYAVDEKGADMTKDVEYKISTELLGDGIEAVTLRMRNTGHTSFQPDKAGIKLGIDTYMDKYPDWFDKYFPTLAVCEPDHFYGYMQSPGGKIKVIVSDAPIASWSIDYNLGYQDPAPHWFYGHRVEALNLDIICRGPLPENHPHIWKLDPGEEMTRTIRIIDIDSIDDFEETVFRHTGAPVLSMESTSAAPGENIEVCVYGNEPVLTIDGERIPLSRKSGNLWSAEYSSDDPGIKKMEVTDCGCSAHGTLAVRHPWRMTMDMARNAVGRYTQKATSNVESWYGFHTAFDVAKTLPDPSIDSLLNSRFDIVLEKVFNLKTGVPYQYAYRIQNVSSTIGMLADRYEAYGNPADLDKAATLAGYLMSCQRPDGAFMNGNTDYTSVIYPAKSLLELSDAERKAGRKKQANLHEKSAKRAIERLVEIDGDFNTEGQLTYEDGMVSCSALQIGALALRTKGRKERERLTDAMLRLLEGHDCLTQLKVPDARQRGGTLRFWEAQYDVFMLPNMISSPHGWSAWRAYATYYAFLLTGEERRLRETFDAATAFANLFDYETGNLNWAFVVDPYVRARQTCEPDSAHTADDFTGGNPHPELYDCRDIVVGRQYVPMISDWQTVNSSDNDVFEVFKFIAESVFTNAFIVEREDGSLGAYNCRIERTGNKLKVTPSEPQIDSLIVSASTPFSISFPGKIINR